jgi:DNA-binding response OmpR family regulator
MKEAAATSGRAFPGSSRPVLVIPDPAIDLHGVSEALRSFSFSPVVVGNADRLFDLLQEREPSAIVAGGEAGDLGSLVADAAENNVPVIFVGTVDQIRLATSHPAVAAAIPIPAEGGEIANVVRLLAGQPAGKRSERLHVGPLEVDFAQQVALIDGDPVTLPPREFRILAELALHAKEPIPPIELARRVSPHDETITGEDIRRWVYRLRKRIGDDRRNPPLIQTRRGFGYVLEPGAAVEHQA